MTLRKKDVDELSEVLNESKAKKQEETDEPNGLCATLKDYQKTGLTWMIWRESQTPSGGILGDDMGLGKTIMTIALIVNQKNQEKDYTYKFANKVPSNATLIIAKKSITHNWVQEIKKFTDENVLTSYIYASDAKLKITDSKKLAEYDVVITNIEMVKEGSPLEEVAWRRVAIDEAHEIRNRGTAKSQNVCRLEAKSRWCITGTPVHNVHWDLYSLIRFLRVKKFSEESEWARLAQDIKGKKQVEISEEAAYRMKLLVECLMLRRMKSDLDKNTNKPIVELPEKTDHSIDIRLKQIEQEAYDIMLMHNISRARKMLEDTKISTTAASKSISTVSNGATMPEPTKKRGMNGVLELLLRQRQACNHFMLTSGVLGPDPEDSVKGLKEDKFSDLFKQTYKSSKLEELFRRLEYAVGLCGHKCVILSDWTGMLGIIETHLKLNKISYKKITGETKANMRQEIINEFNDEKNKDSMVLLLTLKVGDVGLNLIGGNHLFIFEMPWNPAIEQQARDRIYRIGQKKPVYVYKFIVKNSVEERILDVQKRKLELAESIIGGKLVKEPKYTREQIFEIFGMKP